MYKALTPFVKRSLVKVVLFVFGVFFTIHIRLALKQQYRNNFPFNYREFAFLIRHQND